VSISPSDLIAYAALNQPEDETSPAGGAIDPDTRVVFTDLAANDKVEVLSSAIADTTQHITVRGRATNGSLAQETVLLNGTTPVVLNANTFERIESAALDADTAGTVTVRRQGGGATIGTIPPGERGFTRLFIKAFSAAAPKDYYAKVFLKNAHATLSLLDAVVKENADPTGRITFALQNTINDSEAPVNRLTAPVNVTAFGNSDITLLAATGTADLAAGSAIGVWLKLSLDADNAPIKSTYTIELDGNSV
jgi:hypothetical protein